MEKNMSNIKIFKLEDYLAKYEFSAPYLLCCSDVETVGMQEIIDMADEDSRNLWNNLRLGYTEVSGMPALREEIVKSLYPSLTAENILCFAGAEEGIFCALNTICGKDDHVIVLTPCYQSLSEIPLSRGSDVTMVPLRPENQWRIDLEEIQSKIKANTKLVIINFPHNPTGQVLHPDELSGLVDLCRKYDLYLFSDEVYRLLSGEPDVSWALPAAEVYEKAFSLGVMSKAFGMAGLRIGWIASQDKNLLKKFEQLKHYTSICNSGPSEVLTLISLRNKEKILARNNQIVRDNLALLDKFMLDYKDLFEWVRPSGGCIGFVKYKGSMPIEEFTDKLVSKTGVLLIPASVLEYSKNYFRIGFGRKNMPEALEHFKNFLNSFESLN